jgi:hypothetical protein
MSSRKMRFFLLVIIWLTAGLNARGLSLYPQAGVEYYWGANKFRSLKPWFGGRIPLSPWSSLLLKYTFHDLSFDYLRDDGTKAPREAKLSQFIAAIYYAREKLESYAAVSHFRGSESYTAWNLDVGAAGKITSWFALEGGVYLLDESSILWYPDEPVRRIQVGALRAGLDIKITDGLNLNPQVYFYRNSEKVTATTMAVSLIFIPREPFTFVFTFWNYRESAQYRFSGQYFSVGLHLYY